MSLIIQRSNFRSLVYLVAMVGSLFVAVTADTRSVEATEIFRIATASKAGTFYPIGKLIAKGISGSDKCIDPKNCGIPGLIALAQVSNGSVANVEAISTGGIEAGLAQADVIILGIFGNRPLRQS